MSDEFHLQSSIPFPKDLPVAQLDTISLADIESNSPEAKERVFNACKTRGFFYLDFTNSSSNLPNDSIKLGHLAASSFAIPMSAKHRCGYAPGTIFGYKKAGRLITDAKRTPDTAEFWNIPKDEIIAETSRLPWPDSIISSRPLLRAYATEAHALGMQILSVLAEALGVPAQAIRDKHRIDQKSGDMVRLTRGPPRETADMPEIQTPSHTDYGTITILFNWLGGLQVWSNPSRGGEKNVVDQADGGQWLWVQPKRNCAIVNLGDAAVAFTNGVLCSARHRVVPAPGEQGTIPRYSIVYFVRPEDDAILKCFESQKIPVKEGHQEEIRAKDWIMRRANGMAGKGKAVGA